MLKKLLLSTLTAAIVLSTGWAIAAPGDRMEMPRRHAGALDGPPVLASDAAGRTWFAWAYRSGGEFAIALSRRDSRGRWSEPTLIGLHDGLDQVDPALVADDAGNVYLAFVTAETGTVHVAALFIGASDWFEPQQVTELGVRASSPALGVVGDRLVLAYRARGQGVKIVDWALLPERVPNGIQEGPDGFPLPVKQSEEPTEDPLPGEDDSSSSFGRPSKKGNGESP